MISVIVGKKGSGKTKKLIDMANEITASSKGSVVCIEKGQKLTYDINYKVRLIDTDVYGIEGYDAFYAFICGVCASDHDLTHVLVDAVLKIGGKDFDGLIHFLDRISVLTEELNIIFVFTLSCNASELPQDIYHIAEII